MKAMARQRSHSIEFKRQVAQEFVAGETLYALAKRYDVSRNLIRVWVKKLETGVFDDDANAAGLVVCPRDVRFTPQKQTLELSRGMSALCQKRTFLCRPASMRLGHPH
jgi:transposase-like protein